MTITEARTTPVPAEVLLAHRILKAKIALNRYTIDSETAEAETARTRLAALEAEYRAATLVTA
jgi:hypothetical protein